MCGICAFSGVNNFNEDKIKTLLLFNQTRGKDSLGYYVPNNEIYKKLGDAVTVITNKEFKLPEGNTFIGHMRASTVGSVVEKNAHPFIHGNIVLAMNGTLDNHWELAREYKFSTEDFDVDSDVLTAIINKTQSKEALSRVLGACAVLYTDTNTNTLYCYRNSDRPLFRGKLDTGMYLSSIKESLEFIGCTDVKEIKEDTLYEIKDGVVKNNYKVKRAVKEVKVPVILPKTGNILSDIHFTTYERGYKYVSLKMSDYPTESLVGLWLKLAPNYNFQNVDYTKFTEGLGYKILSAVNNWQVTVKNDANKEVVISKYAFDNKMSVVDKDGYAFCTTTLTYTDDPKTEVCTNGDLIQILTIKKDGKYAVCRNLFNNMDATISLEFLRGAYPLEVKEWMDYFNVDTKSKSDTPVENKPTVLCSGESCDNESKEDSPFMDKPQEVKSKWADIFDYQKSIKEGMKEVEGDDLIEFILDNITDIVEDMQELADDTVMLKQISKIDILLQNYHDKKKGGVDA